MTHLWILTLNVTTTRLFLMAAGILALVREFILEFGPPHQQLVCWSLNLQLISTLDESQLSCNYYPWRCLPRNSNAIIKFDPLLSNRKEQSVRNQCLDFFGIVRKIYDGIECTGKNRLYYHLMWWNTSHAWMEDQMHRYSKGFCSKCFTRHKCLWRRFDELQKLRWSTLQLRWKQNNCRENSKLGKDVYVWTSGPFLLRLQFYINAKS